MQERIHFFETRYSYFLGFGILNSLIDMIVPYPYNTCLNDALLPVMCKIAMNVKLKNLHKSRRIRFLYTSDLISEKLLTFTWFILIKQGKYKRLLLARYKYYMNVLKYCISTVSGSVLLLKDLFTYM